MIKKMLSELEHDAIKEIANIGAGNAATALSDMVNKRIDIKVPDVSFVAIEKIAETLERPEEQVYGVLLEINGDIDGTMLLMFEKNTALRLISLLLGEEKKDVDEMGDSTLKEVGNIICAAYLNSLADFLEMKILPSVPSSCYDMAASLLNTVAAQHAMVAHTALLTNTKLHIDKENFKGEFILMTTPKAMNRIIKELNKKMA
ncbi:MAG: chemotaxis protein CheC [Candidatus Aenigmarchaeota archaeon]|nr:chemotaxis protein CheC [Candidatus Aenigmarchaeota archaeon]